MKRQCFECRREIFACNGFVLAGDMLRYYDGLISIFLVRERCWLCVEKDKQKNYPEDYREELLALGTGAHA